MLARLPREGASPGGGRVHVHDRGFIESMLQATGTPKSRTTPTVSEAQSLAESSRRSSQFGTGKASIPSGSSRRAHSLGGEVRGRHSASGGLGPPESVASPGGRNSPALPPKERHRLLRARPDQQEREYADLHSKWQQNEAVREAGDKRIRERLAWNAQMRDERFHRLLESVSRQDDLAHQCATVLKEQEALESRKSRELYAEWEEKVFGPLTLQAHLHMNRPREAGEEPRLLVRSCEDPVKRVLFEDARENAFRVAATRVISGSRSAPELPGLSAGDPAQGASCAPAVSRPILDPSQYSQVREHVPPLGHPSGLRRGREVHLPDESDGVRAAGTRRSRTEGLHNKGILHGDRAHGETLELKREYGSGSAAPAQDHYHFPFGRDTTDLEFPIGKRIFAEHAV